MSSSIRSTAVAVDSAGRPVHIADARRYERLSCAECAGPVVARKGRVNSPHYAHITESSGPRACSGGLGESAKHRNAKRIVAHLLVTGSFEYDVLCASCDAVRFMARFESAPRVTQEHCVGRHRVDVFAETDAARICVEVDHTHRTSPAKVQDLRNSYGCAVVCFSALHVIDVWTGRAARLQGYDGSRCTACATAESTRRALYGHPWCVCAAGGMQMPPRTSGTDPRDDMPCTGACYSQCLQEHSPFEYIRERACNCKLYLCPGCRHEWLPAQLLFCHSGMCMNCAIQGVDADTTSGYTAVMLPSRASCFSRWRVPPENHCVCTLSLSQVLDLPFSPRKLDECRTRLPHVKKLRLPWGQYKGDVLEDLPRSYLQGFPRSGHKDCEIRAALCLAAQMR